MSQSDPVGDMLAIIKNGLKRGMEKVSLPHSKLKEAVCRVLKDEGYVQDVRADEASAPRKSRQLHVYLRYDENKRPLIRGIRRVSRPGCRVFRGLGDWEKVLDGLGITVISTSHGVVSDRAARKERVGGEVICKVW